MNKIVINNDYGTFNLSKTAKNWMKEHYPEFFDTICVRHDPRLVECVETLKNDVNGPFSSLEVKEIEGNVYRIEEYDGKETIVEPKDLEWIIIK